MVCYRVRRASYKTRPDSDSESDSDACTELEPNACDLQGLPKSYPEYLTGCHVVHFPLHFLVGWAQSRTLDSCLWICGSRTDTDTPCGRVPENDLTLPSWALSDSVAYTRTWGVYPISPSTKLGFLALPDNYALLFRVSLRLPLLITPRRGSI